MQLLMLLIPRPLNYKKREKEENMRPTKLQFIIKRERERPNEKDKNKISIHASFWIIWVKQGTSWKEDKYSQTSCPFLKSGRKQTSKFKQGKYQHSFSSRKAQSDQQESQNWKLSTKSSNKDETRFRET